MKIIATIFALVFWAAASFAAGSNPALNVHEKAKAFYPDATPKKPVSLSVIYTGSFSLPPGAVTVRSKTPPGAGPETDAASLDDYDSEPVASIPDPIEPWNRFWFRFNDFFYIYIASPVYSSWTYITPQFVQTAIGNIYDNVLFPTRFINCLLQAKFFAAGVEFQRLMMNVMGSAGMVNLARNKKTIVPMDPGGEDFGQTLGYWGFGQGFYIVWPFIGPSSLRDTFGRVGDYFTDPLVYQQPWYYPVGEELVFRLNDLGTVLPSYEDLKNIAIDPYIAMREAYAASRAGRINQ